VSDERPGPAKRPAEQRRNRAAGWMSVLLAVGGLPETGLLDRRAPVDVTPGPTFCVEHSGGDTRCPGG
jgi:hypothetical protein